MENLNKKKEKEADILKKVYDTTNYEIQYTEGPDFILRKLIENTSFGVEVTEVYDNESWGRLINRKGYAKDIFSRENYIHKIDKEILKLEYTKSKRKDNRENETIKELKRKVLCPYNIAKLLADAINNKTLKYNKYTKEGITHINLIIRCWINWTICSRTEVAEQKFIEESSILELIANFKELKDSILKSPFREIHLVRIVNNEVIVTEIKNSYLRYLNYTINSYFEAKGPDISNYNYTIETLGDYINKLGRTAKYRINNGKYELIWGRLGISKNGTIQEIIDYGELPIEKTNNIVGKHDSILTAKIIAELEELEKYNCERICYPNDVTILRAMFGDGP